MTKKFTFTAIITFLLSSLISSAQFTGIHFGEIDIRTMTTLPEGTDTNDVALVLYHGSVFDRNTGYSTELKRIKILKNEGMSYAELSIPAPSKSSVKGFTYNMVNGAIVKTKLEGDHIFKEKSNGQVTEVSVAFPNVQVGSVIDFLYTYQGFPPTWYFQGQIPTCTSEIDISTYDKDIVLERMIFGEPKIKYKNETKVIAENIPALKEEPLSNYNHHRMRAEFALSRIKLQGHTITVGRTWPEVGKFFKDYPWKPHIADYEGMRSLIDSLKDLKLDKLPLMIAAYNSVQNIKWDNNLIIGPYLETRDILKKKSGNNIDKNLILYKLLKKLDFNPEIIGIGTVNNFNKLRVDFPNMNQINNILIKVKVDNEPYLLDATDEDYPYNLLPKFDLTYVGINLDQPKLEIESILPHYLNNHNTFYSLALTEDLDLTGKIMMKYEDYKSIDKKKELRELANDADMKKHFEEDMKGLSIANIKVDQLQEVGQPLKISIDGRLDNMISEVGNEIYIKPLLFEQLTTNPFQTSTRNMDIDFMTNNSYTHTALIKIPDSYKVVSLPEKKLISIPDNSISVEYEVENKNNTLAIRYKFNRTKAIYLAQDYPILREVFDQIIKLQSEPIILSR
ncbi:MAG: DUF3857 domain-containing protein [Taibaiella sp.]|nr:DUF3857 domain-containing protein [Taibaiella sp.]